MIVEWILSVLCYLVLVVHGAECRVRGSGCGRGVTVTRLSHADTTTFLELITWLMTTCKQVIVLTFLATYKSLISCESSMAQPLITYVTTRAASLVT